jgi:hypothetical protein
VAALEQGNTSIAGMLTRGAMSPVGPLPAVAVPREFGR